MLTSPNSSGPYHCPGKQFAVRLLTTFGSAAILADASILIQYQEMRLVLSTVVRKFDMKLRPGFDAAAFEKSWEDRTITDIQAEFPVILTARKSK